MSDLDDLVDLVVSYDGKKEKEGGAVFKKKNNFKLILSKYGILTVWRKTAYGGYKKIDYVRRIRIADYRKVDYDDLKEVLEETLTWEEVKTEKSKFKKDRLLQNIIGREIANILKDGKVYKLADDEYKECIITNRNFCRIRIYKNEVTVSLSPPSGYCRMVRLKYDTSNPDFDPERLLGFIKKLKKESEKIESQVINTCNDIQCSWEDGDIV